MNPSVHAITSFSLGAVMWFFTGSFYAGLLCFASGTLVDFDHVIEYLIHFGRRDISLRKVYKTCQERLFGKLYLIFHLGELAILLWAAAAHTKNMYILAICVGYSSHLLLDFVANPIHLFSYFFTRRLMKGFKTNHLMK